MEIIDILFRWIHMFTGILWIGLLYFFNFINAQFVPTLDGDAKRKVIPELLPRTLFWFRWGAFWTWTTGVLLLALVFYHSGLHLGEYGSWNMASIIMILVTFCAVFAYDQLFKAMGHGKASISIGYALIALVSFLMSSWAGFSYRGFNIHLAALFGTIMAFNVWFRIWPAQQKIISAVKEGQAPDAQVVALAGMRSKHNTYLSLPLMWGMLNAHTTYFAGGNLGLTENCAWVVYPVVILLSWHIIWQLYKKSTKVKGF